MICYFDKLFYLRRDVVGLTRKHGMCVMKGKY